MAFLLLGTHANAQIRVGLKAGVNASTIHGSGVAVNPRLGLQGGVLVDIPMTKSFSLQPALVVSTKGYKVDFEVTNTTGLLSSPITNLTRLVYAEVPVLALFRARISPSIRFYGGVGPYVALGLSGKLSSTYSLLGEQGVVFNSGRVTSNSYRRVDYGASAAAGLEVKRFLIGLNYTYGLVDLGSATFEAYHRTLGVTVGFWLARTRF